MKKENYTQIIVIVVFVAILGSAGYFGWKEIKKAMNNGGDSKILSELSSDSLANIKENGEEQVYTHPDYGFTLRYPGNLKLGKFPEGEGEIILLQGASANEGFQIFISPYNETEEFSKEVILKAEPKMKIENDKNIKIGGITTGEEGNDQTTVLPIQALSFDSSSDSGTTHEVWFVADGNLYQATSFSQYGTEMERVLGSITFN